MLKQQEILALELIFHGKDQLSHNIRKQVYNANSVNWEETGVGFYSTIKLKKPLRKLPDIRMWEYNFSHPDFPYGGSYMCNIVSENELELEAVTLGGSDWPYPQKIEQFEELKA